MKKLFFSFLMLLIVNSLSAQYLKVRMGLFKKWRIGTYSEVRGHYSIAIDTVSDFFEIYDEEDEGFWGEQYDDHHSEVYDSVRLSIRRYSIIYNNELYDNVYTVKVKPKFNYYELAAQNDQDQILFIIMYLLDTGDWQIYVSEPGYDGWKGVWRSKKL